MKLRRQRDVVVAEPAVVVTEEPASDATKPSSWRATLVPRASAAKGKASDARVKLAPHVGAARERMIPAAELAAERARQTVLDEVLPQVTAAVTAAVTASEPYRREAQRRSKAAAAALRGADLQPPPEEEEQKTHRIRNFLVALGLGGVVAAAYRWMNGGDDDAEWQSAYEPTPAQPQTESTVVHSTTVTGDPSDPLAASDQHTDVGAAGVDEALADMGEQPHSATSPDAPLEHNEVFPPSDAPPRS